MQTHGVTTDRQEFFDNPDAALNIHRRTVGTLREVNLDTVHRASVAEGQETRNGRPVVALPNPETGYDPELVGKSPDEIVAILNVRAEIAEASGSIDRMMRDYPGKSDGVPHSSSSGKRHSKPRPPCDHTKASVRDLRDVGENRPHPVAGRVSTQALVGINRYTTRDASAGTMLDAIGKTLYAGVSWARIEFILTELRLKASDASKRSA
jgi:hypothetical protein